jgi:hypothetical protein
MSELKSAEILRPMVIPDAALVKARNNAIGMLAFTSGKPESAKYADAAEMLRALGLAWHEPPARPPVREPTGAPDLVRQGQDALG